MSTRTSTPHLSDLVAKALMGGDFSGLLMRYDGRCYAQHDSLEIDTSGKQLKLHFLWKGQKVWSLDVGPVGHVATIDGLEGRMQITLHL